MFGFDLRWKHLENSWWNKKSWRNGSSVGKGTWTRNSEFRPQFFMFQQFWKKALCDPYIFFFLLGCKYFFETKSLFWLFQKVFHAPKLHFYAKRQLFYKDIFCISFLVVSLLARRLNMLSVKLFVKIYVVRYIQMLMCVKLFEAAFKSKQME